MRSRLFNVAVMGSLIVRVLLAAALLGEASVAWSMQVIGAGQFHIAVAPWEITGLKPPDKYQPGKYYQADTFDSKTLLAATGFASVAAAPLLPAFGGIAALAGLILGAQQLFGIGDREAIRAYESHFVNTILQHARRTCRHFGGENLSAQDPIFELTKSRERPFFDYVDVTRVLNTSDLNRHAFYLDGKRLEHDYVYGLVLAGKPLFESFAGVVPGYREHGDVVLQPRTLARDVIISMLTQPPQFNGRFLVFRDSLVCLPRYIEPKKAAVSLTPAAPSAPSAPSALSQTTNDKPQKLRP